MNGRAGAPPRGRRPVLDSLGDSELVDLLRRGERAASAELWRRHAAAARTVARAWSSSLDPDDLVSEAFLRVLSTIERGGGPEGAFRPYLFTAVRNVASSWGRRQDRERPLEQEDEVVAAGPGPEERALQSLDRDLGVRAFRALPPRWQEVLWYTEVEGLSPAQAAPLLGLRPNGVAALSLRAREGLRGAWIQEHVGGGVSSGECRWVLERAGAHTRGRLAARDRLRVRSHLVECAECRTTLAEAERAGACLATVLLPLVAGVGGAAAFAAGSASAGAAGGFVVSATGSGAASASGASVGGASIVAMGAAAAGVVLVAGIAAAALLAPSAPQAAGVSETVLSEPTEVHADPAAPEPSSSTAPAPEQTEAPPPVEQASPVVETAAPSPVSAAAPSAPGPALPSPSTAPVPAPTPPAASTPSPTSEPAPTPTLSPTPTPTPSPTRTPTPEPTSTPRPTPPPATAVLAIDPDERLLPGASGTAEPGTRVEIVDGRGGEVYAETRADDDGSWSLPAIPLPPGETAIAVRTTAPGGTVSVGPSETVRLKVPDVLAPSAATVGEPVPVLVLSDPGVVQLLVDGEVVLERDVAAPGFATALDLGAGAHVVGVRYASADGRFGATAATGVVVR